MPTECWALRDSTTNEVLAVGHPQYMTLEEFSREHHREGTYCCKMDTQKAIDSMSPPDRNDPPESKSGADDA